MSYKIKDLIVESEKLKIEELIKAVEINSELEVSFFSGKDTGENLLTIEKFNKLNNTLTVVCKKNEKELSSVKQEMLDVIFSTKGITKSIRPESITVDSDDTKLVNYRLQVSDRDVVNKYEHRFGEKKNNIIYQSLAELVRTKKDENLKIEKKTKNFKNYITIEDIYMKFKLDVEEDLTKDELDKLCNIKKNWKDDEYTIIFRYKERTSYYIKKEKNIYRIDLTLTRTSYKISNINNSPNRCEVELEFVKGDKKNIYNDLFDIAEMIIKIVQQSSTIITKSTSLAVLTSYRSLLGVPPSKLMLHGRKPISIELQHVVDFIPNKYSVTDKADGDRCFLIVVETRCYFITTNLIVIDTGIDVDIKFKNSILDGEYIWLPKEKKHLYMAFDCLFLSSVDVRDEASFMKRIFTADILINELGAKYKHKSLADTKIEFSNMPKIIEFHKKNVQEFYLDIDTELKKSSKILFRRKYFMDVNGTTDNEIYKYASIMWNLFTVDSSVKCPYLLDGLIFQPLTQKYVTEANKSKYPELKWKPPSHNSIDFFIIFEKEKQTKKIVTVYDNSIPGSIKNKPYKICNLHVGYTPFNSTTEKPILFGVEEGVSSCHIYVDELGIPRSIDGCAIQDNTVVEFSYNTELDEGPPYKWVPMKTRFDKTESVQKWNKGYGNYRDTAYNVWKTIKNPVLMSDFVALALDSTYERVHKELRARIDYSAMHQVTEVGTDGKPIYYQKKTKIVENMNSYHNWIKSNIIYTYFNSMYVNGDQHVILDIGCGRGGELQKYYYVQAKLVVGIDPDINGLVTGTDCMMVRYNQLKKTMANFPPMVFMKGTGSALLIEDEQIKLVGKLPVEMSTNFLKIFGEDGKKTQFDRFNCQFAIHYTLSDKDSWNNLCENVNLCLRDGGLFTFTTFDGNILRDKLKDIDRITQFYDVDGEKKILFEIVKKYDDNTKENIGLGIDVHMGWAFDDGVYQTEYLVFPEFIIKELREKCNLELIETDTFENLYNNDKDFLLWGAKNAENEKNKKFYEANAKYYEQTDMNVKCHQYTFLSRFYVFRKIEKDVKKTKEYLDSIREVKSIPRKAASFKK